MKSVVLRLFNKHKVDFDACQSNQEMLGLVALIINAFSFYLFGLTRDNGCYRYSDKTIMPVFCIQNIKNTKRWIILSTRTEVPNDLCFYFSESRTKSRNSTIFQNLSLFMFVFYCISGKYHCGLWYQDITTRWQLFLRHKQVRSETLM